MTPEELLKPRYKVIADYPGNERSVGEIIYSLSTAWDQQELERQIALYPHLFKKLEWWEERDRQDLPLHLKAGEKIYEVSKWLLAFGCAMLIDGDKNEDYERQCELKYYLPATEEEYLNQQK